MFFFTYLTIFNSAGTKTATDLDSNEKIDISDIWNDCKKLSAQKLWRDILG